MAYVIAEPCISTKDTEDTKMKITRLSCVMAWCPCALCVQAAVLATR